MADRSRTFTSEEIQCIHAAMLALEAEKVKLQQRVQVHEATETILRQNSTDIAAQYKATQNTCNQQQTRLTEFGVQYGKLETKVLDLQTQIEARDAAIADLQSKLAKETDENEANKEAIITIRRLEETHRKKSQDINECEIARLRKLHEEQCVELASRADQLGVQLADRTAEYDFQIAELESELEHRKKHSNAQVTTINDLEAKVRKLEEDLALSQRKVESGSAEIAILTQGNSNLVSQRADLTAHSITQTAMINELEAKVRKLEDDLIKQRQETRAKVDDIASLAQTNSNLLSQLTEMKFDLAAANERASELEAKLEEQERITETRCAELADAMVYKLETVLKDELKGIGEKHDEVCATFNDRIAQLEARLCEAEVDHKELEAQLGETEEERDELKAKLATAMSLVTHSQPATLDSDVNIHIHAQAKKAIHVHFHI
jgi:chromosome segregation ATPase